MEENEKIHKAKMKSKLVKVTELYHVWGKKSNNCRTDSCPFFYFYNGNYKYEQGFNKKLTISHAFEAKKAFNST